MSSFANAPSPHPHGLWRWRCNRCKTSLPIATAPRCPHCLDKHSRFALSSIEFDISGWGRYRRRRRVDEVLEAEARAEREVMRLRSKLKGKDLGRKGVEMELRFPTPPGGNAGSPLSLNPVRKALPTKRPSQIVKSRAIHRSLERRRIATLRDGQGNCWTDCDYPGECREVKTGAIDEETEIEESEVGLQGTKRGEGVDWKQEGDISGMEVRKWMERERRAKERLMGEPQRALRGSA